MRQYSWQIAVNILIIFLMLPSSISLTTEANISNFMMFSPQTIERAKNVLINSVAIVQLYWKKLPEDKPGELTGEKSIYKNFAENNTSLDLIGFAIDEDKNIIILDPCFELRRLDKVEITLPKSGKTIEGEVNSVLLRAPALLVRPKNPAQADELKPLPFIQLPAEASEQETFLAVTVLRKLQETFFNLSLIGPGLGPVENERLKFYLYAPLNIQSLTSGYYHSMIGYPISLGAILNNNLQVVGVATHSYLDWTEADAIWKGTTLSKEKELTYAAYSALLENLKNNYEPFLYKIKIEFRQKPEEEAEDVLGAFYRMFGIGRGEKIEDFEGYGFAISEKLLLVPHFIDRTKAAKIKNITITLNDKKEGTEDQTKSMEIEGEFKGAYKDLAAFLIGVKGDVTLKNASDQLDFAEIKPYQPYISLHCEKKFGDKYVICNHFRCFDKTKTKQNKYKWNFYGEISRGDFILNCQGKMVGIFIKEREKDEEIKQYQTIRSSRYERYLSEEREYTPSGEENIIAFADIKEALTAPEKHLDPMIKPLSREEEKEKVWLGIEYVPMTRELAKNLKVEKFTKDGEIGLLVNLIYKGSPAEKIGLKVDDIVLSVRKPEDRYPLELRPPEDEFQEFDFGSVD
ncbi:MAG: PDZ domain-containing protein, partial [Candidatus Sumerlaeia bacterium]|nr:PDZ domain-containing protein [Candidatus Sumerlaeia bacterium]